VRLGAVGAWPAWLVCGRPLPRFSQGAARCSWPGLTIARVQPARRSGAWPAVARVRPGCGRP
jgi:hypothetical protein